MLLWTLTCHHLGIFDHNLTITHSVPPSAERRDQRKDGG